MDTRLLRTFVAVAEHGSFSAAAGVLGYTQSAVSQQIASLEADLGAPLLRRRPVAVTEAGARLLEHARPLLLRLDAARTEVGRAAGPPPATLGVGAAPLAAPLAAAGLATLAALRPRLDTTLRVLARDAVVPAVAAGTICLGLADGVAVPGDPLRLPDEGLVNAVMVAESALMVILPAGHPLAGWPAVHLADLADARWLDAPDTGVALPELRAATGSDGYRASLRYEGTDVLSLLALAGAGLGLAIVPRSALAGAGAADVAAVPLAGPPLVHRVEMVHGALTDAAAEYAATVAGAGRRG